MANYGRIPRDKIKKKLMEYTIANFGTRITADTIRDLKNSKKIEACLYK